MKGEIVSLTREEYDALTDYVNFSTLKLMALSPAHYLAGKKGTKDTASRKRGRAVHVATLEPERFATEYTFWAGDRRTKEWKAFAAANEGREILTDTESEYAKAVAKAVRADPTASAYLKSGAAEVTILWECEGFKMKSRLDWLGACIVDLKNTKDASPKGFGRECLNYRAATQAAMYQDAVASVAGEVLPVVLIAAEAAWPHIVQPYRVPEWALEAGRREYRGWLEQLRWCESQGEFPGYAAGLMDLMLPAWAEREMEASNG